MNQSIDYIGMKIPAKPEFVSVVRLTLSGIASRMEFAYEDIEDLKIAVSEACTNAVQHAYKQNKRGEVTVGFRLYEDRLEVTISDNGESKNIQDVHLKKVPYNKNDSFEALREGGLGLYLMETLMDEVVIHQNEGVTVIMTKYLEREQVERNAKTIST
ncbi:anti-sigma B factor RsbW [Bacillaceae bacterium Marseille-Q3522]|nr:anti-sigma B factor RsbW [Bacillaceae bacterium Marseille-Q3522]